MPTKNNSRPILLQTPSYLSYYVRQHEMIRVITESLTDLS